MPCHISLFNGISPSVHGNLNNSFIPLPADARSLVGECRRGGRRTAMVYSWNELRDIVRPGEVDYSCYERMDNMGRDQQEMIAFERRFVDRALDVIGTGEYDFIFYYYEMADIVGHHQGWMSPEYIEALSVGSECAEKVFSALPEGYSMIITADHGGHDKDHGFEPVDRRIPMWFWGERFPKNTCCDQLRLLDIAPTVLDLVGLPAPQSWEGVSRAQKEGGKDKGRPPAYAGGRPFVSLCISVCGGFTALPRRGSGRGSPLSPAAAGRRTPAPGCPAHR